MAKSKRSHCGSLKLLRNDSGNFGMIVKMSSNFHDFKLRRMRRLEHERRQRIFDDKLRTIGVDKYALEDQIREKKLEKERLNLQDEAFKKNLNFYNEQAILNERLLRLEANKEAEYSRTLENMLLASEQTLRNRRINEEAKSNIPTDEYYNYFNMSSR